MSALATFSKSSSDITTTAEGQNLSSQVPIVHAKNEPAIKKPVSAIEFPMHRILGDLMRTLQFYTPPRYGSPPRFLVAHPNGSGVKNYGTTPISVTIRDMRHKEHRFHLSLHSFKPLKGLTQIPYPLDLKDTSTMTMIQSTAIETIYRNLISPGQITIFDTTVLKAANSIGFPPLSPSIGIAQTPNAALLRAKRHLTPQQASEIEEGHLSLRIVTLYRPLKRILDHPLAVAESFTVNERDLVPVEHVYPDRVGQAYALKYSNKQKFWYWSGMDATEGLLVQVYDSLTGVDAGGRDRSIRGATAFFKLMPAGWEEARDAEWLVVRALVAG